MAVVIIVMIISVLWSRRALRRRWLPWPFRLGDQEMIRTIESHQSVRSGYWEDMSQLNVSVSEQQKDKSNEFIPFPLLEFPRGDFNDYCTWQIWILPFRHNSKFRIWWFEVSIRFVHKRMFHNLMKTTPIFASYILCWCEFSHLHHVGVSTYNIWDVEISSRRRNSSFQNSRNVLLDRWWTLWNNIKCSRTAWRH